MHDISSGSSGCVEWGGGKNLCDRLCGLHFYDYFSGPRGMAVDELYPSSGSATAC